VLLSRYKLTDLKFSAFSRKGRPYFHDENWASKGVVTATVEAWPDGPTFRIGISHACTDAGGSAQPNIRQLASQTTTNHTGPAIMMGDLNVHDDRGEGKGEYATMRDIFAAIDANEAYLKVHGADAKNGSMVNKKENLLRRLFSTETSVEDTNVRGVDYVFVRESDAGWRLTPEKAEVISDWKYPAAASKLYGHPHMSAPKGVSRTILIDLSDHYPVKVAFSAQRQ